MITRFKMRDASCVAVVALIIGANSTAALSAVVSTAGTSRPEIHNLKTVGQMSVGVQVAQAGDAAFRINQLEDQVRRLNGQVEDLNFQLLQMQEQMRRMQEDNEFRFQELEGKKSGNLEFTPETKMTKKDAPSLGKSQASESTVKDTDSGETLKDVVGNQPSEIAVAKLPKIIDGVEIFDPENPKETAGRSGTSIPLGTITFDSSGNVISTAVGKPLDLTFKGPRNSNLPAAAKENSGNISDEIASPEELYNLGFEYFQAGDYVNAEKIFSTYMKRFAKGKKVAKASFWLGESLFAQAKFKDSAQVFLDSSKKWPKSRLGAQTMLKLGLSLAGMQQRELACATYAKVFKKYPNMSNSVRKRVVVEQKSARCVNS